MCRRHGGLFKTYVVLFFHHNGITCPQARWCYAIIKGRVIGGVVNTVRSAANLKWRTINLHFFLHIVTCVQICLLKRYTVVTFAFTANLLLNERYGGCSFGNSKGVERFI